MTRRKMTALAVAGTAMLAAAGGGFVWWHGRQGLQATENAFVEADTVAVSAQVPGYVAEVLVNDNQAVRPGQALVRLDPAEAETRLQQAEAEVSAALAAARNVDDRVGLEGALINQRQAALQSARAEAGRARADVERYAQLAARGFVTEQRMQTLRAAAARADAAVAEAQAALEAERRSAQSLGSTKAQSLAQADQGHAAVRQARINLERLQIASPVAGVVGARAVRVGQFVQPGAPLLSIVPLGRSYVVANFKETQVGAMRIGQPVEIRADAFPGRVIHGRVDSFAPATGSKFALIPVENATGNFTKIVQRLPVRIAVDEKDPLAAALRPGLSLEVEVDTRVKTGAGFAEAAALGVARAAR